MSERILQRRCRKHAERLGFLSYKFESPNQRGVPDVIFISPKGYIFFVEFKNPNGKGRLSPLQKVQHDKLIRNGADVYTVDSEDFFLEIIKRIK